MTRNTFQNALKREADGLYRATAIRMLKHAHRTGWGDDGWEPTEEQIAFAERKIESGEWDPGFGAPEE